ncbi:BMP/retinoic acid-inducible neural-specific protein 2 [Tachysurus ichikawai]
MFHFERKKDTRQLQSEESLTIFLDKQKLSKKSEVNGNSSTVSLEILHQLAASYFTDRESTLRRLHHLQIATSAIKEVVYE